MGTYNTHRGTNADGYCRKIRFVSDGKFYIRGYEQSMIELFVD